MKSTESTQQKDCSASKRSGPSSYHRHDHDLIFRKLGLKSGHSFLDLGSGRGDFAVHASRVVGQDGSVFALEKEEQYANALAEYAAANKLDNIITVTGDMTAPLLLRDNSADICLACTSMHFLDLATQGRSLFLEVRRILNPGGVFGVVECSKEDLSYGPPEHMRNAPEEYEPIVRDTGFTQLEYVSMGFLYMLLFQVPIAKGLSKATLPTACHPHTEHL